MSCNSLSHFLHVAVVNPAPHCVALLIHPRHGHSLFSRFWSRHWGGAGGGGGLAKVNSRAWVWTVDGRQLPGRQEDAGWWGQCGETHRTSVGCSRCWNWRGGEGWLIMAWWTFLSLDVGVVGRAGGFEAAGWCGRICASKWFLWSKHVLKRHG